MSGLAKALLLTSGVPAPSGLGLFIAAVDNVSDSGELATSPDGITWTQRTVPNTRQRNDIVWSPELGLLAACSDGFGTGLIITSPDGIDWTERTVPSSGDDLIRGAWSPELGLFVFTGQQTITSPDGITWTQRTVPSGAWQAVAWSPELGLFVIVGGAGVIATSPDGITWTQRTAPNSTTRSWVFWASSIGRFIADSGTRVVYSPDGIDWTAGSSIISGTSTYDDGVWSPDLELMMLVRSDRAVVTSPTGLNGSWTQRTSLASSMSNVRRVEWSTKHNMFIVTAWSSTSGSGATAITTDVGVSWTTAATAFPWRVGPIRWS